MTYFAGYDFQPQIVPRTPRKTEAQLCLQVHSSSGYTASWTPMPRKSIHRWTIEEQAILCVLERWFTSEKPAGQRLLSFRDMRRTFCAYFADSMRFEGESGEITDNAISAQLWEVKNEGDYNVAWREVYLETDFLDPFDEWAATREELAATAALLGIVLLRKTCEDKAKVLEEASSQAGLKRKRIHHARPWTNDRIDDSGSKSTEAFTPLTPSTLASAVFSHPDRSLKSRTATNQSRWLASAKSQGSPYQRRNRPRLSSGLSVPQTFLLTPEPSPHRAVKRTKRGIRRLTDENDLLFRYWDSNSQGINSPQGFIAGAYMDVNLDISLPTVPGLLSEDFLIPAEPHLLRKHEATPFISVYDSLRPALHRALRSGGENVSIAIIDAHAVDGDQDSEHPRAVWVRNVAQELKSRGRYGLKYEGETEWLVWGRIRKEAIVSTISIDSLRAYSHTHRKLERVFHLNEIQRFKSWKRYTRYLRNNAVEVGSSVGKVVGGFLAFCRIPEAHLESMAVKLGKVWSFRGLKDRKKKQDYVEGVYDGFTGHDSPEDSATEDLLAMSDDDTIECLEDSDDDFAKRRRRIETILCGHRSELQGATSIEDGYNGDW